MQCHFAFQPSICSDPPLIIYIRTPFNPLLISTDLSFGNQEYKVCYWYIIGASFLYVTAVPMTDFSFRFLFKDCSFGAGRNSEFPIDHTMITGMVARPRTSPDPLSCFQG